MISIEIQSGNAVFSICKTMPKINYNLDIEYTWYTKSDGLNLTKGTASGFLLQGEYREYSVGSLRYLCNYNLGVREGISKVYNEEGKLIATYKYKAGEIIYSKKRPKNGIGWIEYIGFPFKQGTERNEYTEEGIISYKEIMKSQGQVKKFIYYDSGKLKYSYTEGFVTGIKEDTFTFYYENGKIGTIGVYEMDSKKGDWKFYDETGKSKGIEKYRIHKEFYIDGEIKIQGGEAYDEIRNEWVKNGRWFYSKENGDWNKVENWKWGEYLGEGFDKKKE
jgi:antitoxin component YwqK of YwqJK toxin-antitoxin module